MYRVVKSPEAQRDLEGIWEYSFNLWGEDQADLYYDELLDRIENLVDNPRLGKSCDDIRPGYRSIQFALHVVYYRLMGEDIDIVRVLHERMMPGRHLL